MSHICSYTLLVCILSGYLVQGAFHVNPRAKVFDSTLNSKGLRNLNIETNQSHYTVVQRFSRGKLVHLRNLILWIPSSFVASSFEKII